MIAAISPADYDETISTLRYADQAKKIKTKAVVNEDPSAKIMRELKDEVDALRQALMVYAPEEVEKITATTHPVKGSSAPAAAKRLSSQPLQATTTTAAAAKSKLLALPSAPASSKSTVVFTDALGNTTQLTKEEMVDQLQMTEKLLGDLNQTWEEKLNNTEKIHVEREKSLKNLGITIEKNAVGLYTPKEIPYLINLNEDPLMSECLMYNIKPGTTHVDRVVMDEDTAAENIERNDDSGSIRLSGTNINENHCYFENTDDIVTLYPRADCTTMVNGMRISEPKRLKSGYRIILGDHHVFRFNNPGEAMKERDTQQQQDVTTERADSPFSPPSPISSEKDGFLSPALGGSEVMDWNFARREAMLNTYINDSNFGNLTNEDLDKLFDDVAKVRVIRKRQSTSSDTLSRRTSSSSSVRRSTYSTTASSVFMDDGIDGYYTTDTSTISSTSSSSSSRDELMLLAKDEQEIQMEHHRRKYAAKLRRLSRRISYAANQNPLSFTPKERDLGLKVIDHWKRKRNVAMAKTILVNDLSVRQANDMAAKLKKDVFYQFAVIHDNTSAVSVSHWDQQPQQQQKSIDIDLMKAQKPCVGIQVVDKKHQSIYIWSVEKFMARFRYLQGAYYASDSKKHMKGEDLYYESATPPSYVLVGLAKVSLRNLATQVPVESTLAVHCRNTGRLTGTLKVLIAPIARSVRHPYRSSNESEDGDASVSTIDDENPRNLLHVGQQLVFEISIIELSGMDPKEFSRVHAQFRLSTFGNNLDGVFAADAVEYKREAPIVFNYHQTLSMAITEEILHIINTKDITFEVYGKPIKEYLDKLSPTAPAAIIDNTEVIPATKSQDVIAHIQVCEITPDGDYKPVPVESITNNSNNNSDAPNVGNNDVFSLQQGQQRRITLSLQHQGGETRVMPLLEKITEMRVGQIRLIDGKNRIIEQPASANSNNAAEISLNLLSSTSTQSVISANGAWDSSLHDTLLLNAITPNTHKVVMTLYWTVRTTAGEAVRFEKDISVHIKDQSKAANIKKKSAAAAATPNKRGSVILNFFSIKPNHIKSQVTSLFVVDCKPDLYGSIHDLPVQALPAQILDNYHAERQKMIRRDEADAMKFTVFLVEQLDRLCNDKAAVAAENKDSSLDAEGVLKIWTRKSDKLQQEQQEDELTALSNKPIVQKWTTQVHQIMIPEDCKSKKGFLMRKNDADGKEWDKYWCAFMG
jgi:kinesin family protein 1